METRNLEKRYGKFKALNGVELRVEEGEIPGPRQNALCLLAAAGYVGYRRRDLAA